MLYIITVWLISALICYYINIPQVRKSHTTRYTVGMLIMATGRYSVFAEKLIASAQQYFCPQHDVTFFVFTDQSIQVQDNVVVIPQQQLGWPYDSLMRFHVYDKHKERFAHMDYIFSCDADMLFVDYVGDEILGQRVATQHPGFLFEQPVYETNPLSTACVHVGQGKQYVAGAFYGGTKEEFLLLIQSSKKSIDTDIARGIIARVNDESYLNHYFTLHTPTVLLSPSYCHFTHWRSPYQHKLLAIDDKEQVCKQKL